MTLSKGQIASYLIFGLSTLVFCNLNGLSGVYLGINAPFSPLILLLCIAIIGILGFRLSDYNKSFIFFVTGHILFWVVGFLASLYYLKMGKSLLLSTAREVFTTLVIYWTYYLYVARLPSEQHKDTFIQQLLYLSVFTCLVGVLESVLGYTSAFSDMDRQRSLGFFGNPNETGLQCNLTLMLACYLFIKDRLSLVLFAVIAALSLYGAVLSFSKSAIILGVLILIFFALYNFVLFYKLNKKRKIAFSVLSGAVFALLVTVVVPAFFNFYVNASFAQKRRINAIYELVIEGKINKKTTSERSEVIPDALRLIGERPLFGYGLKSFSKSGLFKTDIGIHNTYLKLWGEGGILSILMWFVFIFHLGFSALFFSRYPDSFFILCLLMIISFYFMVSHTVLSRKFVIPLIAVASALYFSSKNKEWSLLGK